MADQTGERSCPTNRTELLYTRTQPELNLAPLRLLEVRHELSASRPTLNWRSHSRYSLWATQMSSSTPAPPDKIDAPTLRSQQGNRCHRAYTQRVILNTSRRA